MARQLSAAYHEALGAKEGRDPFVWLLEVEVPTTPPTMYRLTNNPEPVEYGQTSAGAAITYSPAGIEFEVLEESGDGSLPEMQITLPNASQFARQVLEDHRGLTGQPATLYLVNVGLLSGPDVAIRWRGEIGEPTVTVASLTLPLSSRNLTDLPFPSRRDLADSCAVRKFGSGPCPYPVEHPSAAYSSCPRTRAACEDRGTDMVSIGFPALLPKRFGGVPGLGRQQ